MAPAVPTILRLRACTVDLPRRQVQRGEELSSLTPKEASVLEYLAARPEQIVSREDLLTDVWGYHPNVQSRTLDTTIRTLRAKVEADRDHPAHILTEYGQGYRFVGSPRELSYPGFQVVEFDGFVGREEELARLGALFGAGHRLVTVVGPPGVGKTRLLRHHAAVQDPQQGGLRALFVDLSMVSTALQACQTLAPALGTPLDERGAIEQIGRALRARGRLLLILDNMEQLVAELAPVLPHWLERAPGLMLGLTSRERMRLAGEQVIELAPLPLERARELLLQRGRAVRPDFLAGEEALAMRIVEALDGLPLAVELAAARANLLGGREMIERLSHKLDLLGLGRRGGQERQSTLKGAIDWSWELLPTSERRALAQLSVFAQGFSLDAADGVLELGPEGPWAMEAVQALVDKSLLYASDSSGHTRYHQLAAVAEYAAWRLQESGGAGAAEQRHARTMLALCESWLPHIDGRDGARLTHRLGAERENLEAIRRRALPAADQARAALLLDRLLRSRGSPEARLERLVRVEVGLEPTLALRVALARGRAALELGRLEEAAAELAVGRQAAAGLAEERLLAELHLLEASLGLEQGRVEEARTLVEAGLHQARIAVDGGLQAQALGLRARLGQLEGQPAEQIGVTLREAIRLARRAEHRRAEAALSLVLGRAAAERGAWGEAEEALRAAYSLARHLEDWSAEAGALLELGRASAGAGRAEDAEAALRSGLSLHRQLGQRLGEAMALVALGGLLRQGDQASEAPGLLREGIALAQSLEHRGLEAEGWAELGAWAEAQGDEGLRLACLAELGALRG
jgi:predicted ATPase/DNA-binding winged helix-turn-helix (wHTH) protein